MVKKIYQIIGLVKRKGFCKCQNVIFILRYIHSSGIDILCPLVNPYRVPASELQTTLRHKYVIILFYLFLILEMDFEIGNINEKHP